ncbi:hypothetical protein FIBSPDRAFT_902161 [Athelia psychrophila]|uniref:Uncharacterized protein n=1 Tax=Athelia psychrophila TaxID=1759441 RepID=A0A167XKR7_9AGAM|nr:hypothetical protein FIBSPDRAFT_902161 [Fibularhizoctonia sp. CBS 109695]
MSTKREELKLGIARRYLFGPATLGIKCPTLFRNHNGRHILLEEFVQGIKECMRGAPHAPLDSAYHIRSLGPLVRPVDQARRWTEGGHGDEGGVVEAAALWGVRREAGGMENAYLCYLILGASYTTKEDEIVTTHESDRDQDTAQLCLIAFVPGGYLDIPAFK